MSAMSNYVGALSEYKKAVEMAPQQPGTHYKLGDAYWVQSDWVHATEQFQAELSNEPANCMAQWKLGNILLEQYLSPEEALADVDKALAMCPNLADARLDRGRALLRLHRDADAIPDLEAAKHSEPDEPNVHFLLAQAYRTVGRASDAQAEMKLFSKLEESARAAKAERAERLLHDQSKPPDK